MLIRAALIAVVGLMAALAARSAIGDEPAAADAIDPIEWIEPHELPKFREVVPAKEYKWRLVKAASDIDIAALAKANQPLAGLRVTRVYPGYPAETLGVKAGDLITALDGDQVWQEFPRDAERVQIMSFISKDGKKHDVQIKPGKIGIASEFEWQPQFEYLRSPLRNPKWDEEALVGIMMRASEPDLAETALHHAVAKGLTPDQLIDGVGAEIAFEQGRNAAALDYVWSALVVHHTQRRTLFNPELIYRVAIANYKLDVAAAILRDYLGATSADADMLEHLARLHRARPDRERLVPPPNVQAENLRRIDLSPILESEAASTEGKNYFNGRDSFSISTPSSHYSFLDYKPRISVRDMELSMQLSIRPTDKKKTEYAREVEIWFGDNSKNTPVSPEIGDFREPTVLHLTFNSEHPNAQDTIGLGHSGISGTNFTYVDPLVKLNGKQFINVRLLRIGGEGEIFVDGRRVVYAPIDSNLVNLAFGLQVVGTTINVKRFHLSELVPKVTVHQESSGRIVLNAADANLHGNRIRYNASGGRKCIDDWWKADDWCDWDVAVEKPGQFRVTTFTAATKDLAGSHYTVGVNVDGGAAVAGTVKPTSRMNAFRPDMLGTIEITKPGHVSIAVRATSMRKSRVMTLKMIELAPTK